MSGLLATDNYPSHEELGDLFVGSQLGLVGRYNQGGNYEITLSGMLREESFQATKTLFFDNTGGSGYLFVTRLWAREKINDLLNQIELSLCVDST